MPYRSFSRVAFPRKDNFRLTCGITSEPASDSVVGAGTRRESQAQASLRCHGCGMELGAAKKFCRFCGAPVQPPAAPIARPQGATIACPKCGTTVSAGKKFCKACGYQLGPVRVPEPMRTGQEPSAKAVTAAGAAAAVRAVPEPFPVEVPPAARFEGALVSELGVFRTPQSADPGGVVTSDLAEPALVGQRSEQSLGGAIPMAQGLPPSVATEQKRRIRYWIGGALVLAALLGIAAWHVWFSPEARLFRVADRGDLVTPTGSSAYDYYNRLKARGWGLQRGASCDGRCFPSSSQRAMRCSRREARARA